MGEITKLMENCKYTGYADGIIDLKEMTQRKIIKNFDNETAKKVLELLTDTADELLGEVIF